MAETAQVVDIDGRRLRLTNLGKVVYPETGTTKGEVVAYYSMVAPRMLPLLVDRPVTRKRWVSGVGTTDAPGDSFFAKQLEPGAPDWLRRRPIEHSGGAKEYPLVNDLPSLVWAAQVAALELHVPQWRFSADGARRNPDRIVLDLDPGPGVDLAQCAHVARLARAILTDIGLDPVPVTSGSKGIHLYAALDGRSTSDQAATLAKELARAIESDHPDIVTSTMAKAARGGRVFLDWSQNNGAKTTIAPYSMRGRVRPTVAAPRTWAELEDPALAQLEFDEVLLRVEAGLDPASALAPVAASPLAPYLAKRRSSRTPEPMPEAAPGPSPDGPTRFVVQEHAARRLHYDLRIERDGVLVCWAVPKGIPDIPDRNHLAVMTEPHPIEYLSFHGAIPKGEYGAGQMTIWDSGTVEIEKWRDHEVIGVFSGSGPLGRARLALIRTDGDGEKSSWLLHRMREQTVTAPRTAPVPQAPSPMLAERGTPGIALAMPDAWAEIKWDGIRAIGTWSAGRMTLHARSGTDITARYPELTANGAPHLAVQDAVVDGEIIALDTSGRPSFSLLQSRMHLTNAREIEHEATRTPIAYHLFDLLRLDGHDLARVPLRDRRALLETLIASADPPLLVPPVFVDIEAALATSRELGLEGVVVKDAGSPYRAGIRSGSWVKLKHTRMQEAVIIGIRPGSRAGAIGSLLLALPDHGGLRYIGRVGSGFSERALRELHRLLAPLRTDENPATGVPAADARDAQWVHPELVGEVEFANWTPGLILRHARWRGLRMDTSPDEIVRET